MERVGEIDPRVCREYAQEPFTIERMAREYAGFYERAIAGETW